MEWRQVSSELTVAAVLDLFRPVHTKIRDDLAGLEATALNWRPGADTNSIGAIVQHIEITERRNLLRITDSPDSQPGTSWDPNDQYSQTALLAALDRADTFLDRMSRTLAPDALSSNVTHPHRGPSTALVLLLETYGHVKEHLGHIELTSQLFLQSGARQRG
jgi:hypothetical protein